MLERPDIQDETIAAWLRDTYGLPGVQVTFLPLGVGINASVFRAIADDGAYFAKLRRGTFDETAVALPKFLSDQGIAQIIAPLPTRSGQLWTTLDDFAVVLYPFVEGRSGYDVALSHHQWRDFGAALRRIHAAQVPSELANTIQTETFSAEWRERVRVLLSLPGKEPSDDPISAKLEEFLKAKRDIILDLVERAERYALALQAQLPTFVLCHSDLHPGNLHLTENGDFYIVDWDEPIFAPKEHDLMFVGGGLGFVGRSAQEEEALFYQGYGETEIDSRALAYYRYERILRDVVLFSEWVFSAAGGDEDREQGLRFLAWHFSPGTTVEMARKADVAGNGV